MSNILKATKIQIITQEFFVSDIVYLMNQLLKTMWVMGALVPFYFNTLIVLQVCSGRINMSAFLCILYLSAVFISAYHHKRIFTWLGSRKQTTEKKWNPPLFLIFVFYNVLIILNFELEFLTYLSLVLVIIPISIKLAIYTIIMRK